MSIVLTHQNNKLESTRTQAHFHGSNRKTLVRNRGLMAGELDKKNLYSLLQILKFRGGWVIIALQVFHPTK